MKKCSSCGTGYPDEATSCSVDGQSLISVTQTKMQPRGVHIAVAMLYVALGIGIARSIMEASANSELAGPGLMMFIVFAVLGFVWLLIAMVDRGRNWARITFLIGFLLGLLPSIWPLIRSLSVSPLSGFLGLAQIVLQIVALILLFQQEASEWFRAKASGPKPT